MTVKNSFGIDWLRFAIVPVLWEELVSLLSLSLAPSDWEEASRYERAWYSILEEGVTIWIDKPLQLAIDGELEERIILDFSGNGLANWAIARGQSPLGVLGMMRDLSSSDDMVSVTRIDPAFDDFQGFLDVDKAYRHTEKLGLTVTNWRTWAYMESGKIQTCDSKKDKGRNGKTFYFGTRKSLSFARLYDKKAQIESKMGDMTEEEQADYLAKRGLDSVPEWWHRFELELKGEKAHAFAVALLNADDPATCAVSLLKGQIDFKAHTGHKRVRRRKSVRWWQEFTQSIEPMKIRIPKPIQTVELKKEYLIKQAFGSLATVKEAEPDSFGQWLNEQISAAVHGMTPEQDAIAERHRTRSRLELEIEHGW